MARPPPPCQTARMVLNIDRLLSVWNAPVDEGTEAGFRGLYADPFLLNGVRTSITDLVRMADGMHAAVTGQSREILDVVTQPPDKGAVACVVRGRHAGTLPTRVGRVPATERPVEMTVIDVFTVA